MKIEQVITDESEVRDDKYICLSCKQYRPAPSFTCEEGSTGQEFCNIVKESEVSDEQ